MTKLNENPENIEKVTDMIFSSLDEETCWTNAWNKENPLLGHCRVVAAMVYDIFGGSVKWAQINERTDHYWNVLPSGKELDLTRGQFSEETIIPEGIVMDIKKVRSGPTMSRTYPILQKRILRELKA